MMTALKKSAEPALSRLAERNGFMVVWKKNGAVRQRSRLNSCRRRSHKLASSL